MTVQSFSIMFELHAFVTFPKVFWLWFGKCERERQKTHRHLQQGQAPASKPSLEGTFFSMFQIKDILHLLQSLVCMFQNLGCFGAPEDQHSTPLRVQGYRKGFSFPHCIVTSTTSGRSHQHQTAHSTT